MGYTFHGHDFLMFVCFIAYEDASLNSLRLFNTTVHADEVHKRLLNKINSNNMVFWTLNPFIRSLFWGVGVMVEALWSA